MVGNAIVMARGTHTITYEIQCEMSTIHRDTVGEFGGSTHHSWLPAETSSRSPDVSGPYFRCAARICAV
ncbi:hypothetical protein NRB20_23910 [Nocardia sp. RB20]|uniref:Uncharacterized protein n=1 Tax=Nocardia macrotermitis TaxID=2585198 RepID=A0A7K0D0Q1_9NOCA|nr:hypothetical protein [Nocardia macrotermitis]